jgi:hypothetical protein
MLALARMVATLLVVVMVAQGGARAAETLTAADQAAMHSVIQTQIDALKRDDFAGAYAVAAPSLKVLYPTVDAFTRLIKSRYAQLIRPKTFVFGTVLQTDQGPVQRVFVTAADGKAYIANYSLQRQADNSWLIGGCTVSRDSNSSAI